MSRQERSSLTRNCTHKPLAGIDLGSHTARLLVVQVDGDTITPVLIERRVTRTASDFDRTGSITAEALERNVRALEEYAGILSRFGVETVACGATGVLRRAENREQILDQIRSRTNMEAKILAEEEEAFLSAKGMFSVLPEQPADCLLFDVGGGSTEFLRIVREDYRHTREASMPVGAATLTGTCLFADPPGRASLRQAREVVHQQISRIAGRIIPLSDPANARSPSVPLRLIGTAGTVTTLAAMFLGMTEYVPYRVNGLVLTKDWISTTVTSLSDMPLAARRGIPGLEPGREDIILGGAVIVDEVLAFFGGTDFIVTDAGLLEGLVLELTEKRRGLPRSLTTGLTWRIQKG